MASLDTVGKITGYARVLLQDTLEPYRYSTVGLVGILNAALMDARRLRPDLFLYNPNDVPFYTYTDATAAVDLAKVVDIDQQYRMALVYFVAGQAQLRDEEDVTDARAATFMLQFRSILTEPLMPQSVSRRSA